MLFTETNPKHTLFFSVFNVCCSNNVRFSKMYKTLQTLEITRLVGCQPKCTLFFGNAPYWWMVTKKFFSFKIGQKRTLFSLPQLHDPGAKGRVTPVIARVWPIYLNLDLISLQLKKHTLFLLNSNVCSDDKVWFFGAYKTPQTLAITGLVRCRPKCTLFFAY